MLFKNVAGQKIHVYAYDSTTGEPKTGDAANITAYVSLDGTSNAVDDTNPAEVDATNLPGIYCFDLAQAETNCNAWVLFAKSATASIRIEPIIGFTTAGAVPLAVAGATSGLSIVGSKMDLIDAPNATGISAIVTAINSLATYGLTALNTLLVTTGIKAATIPAATLAASQHVIVDSGTVSIIRPTGTVATDGGNSATVFKTDLASAVDDFWKGAYLKMTSGALTGQVRKVSGYAGGTKSISLSAAFTATPADSVTFSLVNE